MVSEKQLSSLEVQVYMETRIENNLFKQVYIFSGYEKNLFIYYKKH